MTARRYATTNAVLVGVSVLCSLVVAVFQAGSRVPVHWTTSLQPDRSGSVLEFALVAPLAELVFFGLGGLAARAEPEDGGRTRAAVTAVVALCAALHMLFSVRTFL